MSDIQEALAPLSTDDLKLLAKAFKEYHPTALDRGICSNLYTQEAVAYHPMLVNNFRQVCERSRWLGWPHHSGDPLFPVPSTQKGLYIGYYNEVDKYNHYADYGRLRWDLITHLATTLQAEIDRRESTN